MMLLAFNTFQILFLGLLGFLFVGSFIAMARGWAGRREGSGWALLCLLAAAATARPELTGAVARFLGIGRGADLVFYSAVVVMMIGFWMTYMRLRHLRREMTLLVRQIAILEAERDLLRDKSESRQA
ncbi:MAG: DUF2304 family protein [Phycisphaerae bacterium]